MNYRDRASERNILARLAKLEKLRGIEPGRKPSKTYAVHPKVGI